MTGRTTVKKDPTDRVVQELLAGRHDSGVARIAEAIRARIEQSDVGRLRWKLDLPDLTVTEDDLTLDEAFRVEKAAGLSWVSLDPINSASHSRAIVLVCYQTRLGLSEEEAEAKLSQLTVSDVISGISRFQTPENPTTSPT